VFRIRYWNCHIDKNVLKLVQSADRIQLIPAHFVSNLLDSFCSTIIIQDLGRYIFFSHFKSLACKGKELWNWFNC